MVVGEYSCDVDVAGAVGLDFGWALVLDGILWNCCFSFLIEQLDLVHFTTENKFINLFATFDLDL